MRVYLVDYENVNSSGIEGIEKLDAADRVCIFYSELIKSMPFETGIRMVDSQAGISFFKTKKIAKNYLDFQLSTFLGFIAGTVENANIYIVSKDTGFDSVVDFWSGKEAFVKRISDISASFEEEKTIEKEEVFFIPEEVEVLNPAKSEKKKKGASLSLFPEQYRKMVRAAVKNENIPPSGYTVIYKAIVESANKKELHNELVKSFNNQGPSIYKLVKKTYDVYCNEKTKQG